MELKVKNRNNKSISVIVNETKDQKGLAFIMHGLGGFKEQPHILRFAKAFEDNGYTTVLFDTTNSIGESDGSYEDATITNYSQDLEDVIDWAKDQSWYQEPFCLAGHSLGGMGTSMYAQKFPQKVKALAPISSAVSGSLLLSAYTDERLKTWKETGWRINESNSKPGVIKKLKWNFVIDAMQHDISRGIEKLSMPILLITGSNDTTTPVSHQRIIHYVSPGVSELHVIEGAGHTFRDEVHLNQIYDLFSKWIGGLE